MRKPLPSKLEREVLVRNKHCCCICQKDGVGKEIWVHHIDGNNSNNVISNLAVLCVSPHASLADAGLIKGKLGSGKKLTPEAVREYKRKWERKIAEESKIPRRTVPIQRRMQLEILYYFEIHKVKNEIMAFEDDISLVKDQFQFLQGLVVEDFRSGIKLRKMLADAYGEIAIESVLGNGALVRECGIAIYGLFTHLIGPKQVKADREDLRLFNQALDDLAFMAKFAAEFSDSVRPLKNTCGILYNLGELAHWYNWSKQKVAILRALQQAKVASGRYEKEGRIVRREQKKRIDVVDKVMNKLKVKYRGKRTSWGDMYA